MDGGFGGPRPGEAVHARLSWEVHTASLRHALTCTGWKRNAGQMLDGGDFDMMGVRAATSAVSSQPADLLTHLLLCAPGHASRTRRLHERHGRPHVPRPSREATTEAADGRPARRQLHAPRQAWLVTLFSQPACWRRQAAGRVDAARTAQSAPQNAASATSQSAG